MSAPEPVTHPAWCDRRRCSAALDGAHVTTPRRLPMIHGGMLWVTLEQDADSPEPTLQFEEVPCACRNCSALAILFSLDLASARNLITTVGKWLDQGDPS